MGQGEVLALHYFSVLSWLSVYLSTEHKFMRISLTLVLPAPYVYTKFKYHNLEVGVKLQISSVLESIPILWKFLN